MLVKINHFIQFIFHQKRGEDGKSSQLLLTLANEREKVTEPKRPKLCSKIIKVIIAGNNQHGH